MKKIDDILDEELNKLKISKKEREILIEDFECVCESFLEDEGPDPSSQKIRKLVKDYLKENAKEEKPHMRQVEKEQAQWDCLLNAFKKEGLHLSVKEMSEYLIRNGFSSSSTKTLYRRITKELPEHDIKQDSDGKYYYDNPWEEQNKINNALDSAELSEAEKKEQISIISNFLESIKDSPVYEKAKKFLAKEEKKLQSFGNKNTNSANFSRILFMGAPEANIKKETWDTIYKAMGTNSILQIEYMPEGKKRSETYKVQPFQLIFDNGIWELWSYCLKKNHEGMRLFNLSRISNVHILALAGKFILPKNFNFIHSVVGNFGCYNDETLRLYKIKFHKDSYAWLYSKDRIWGGNQTIEETESGFILSFEAKQFKPILRWILGWGDEAEPLAPAELVVEWKKKVEKMAEATNLLKN